MKNSNNFNNKSEIIAKLILNKIFSYVETEIKKRDIEEKIPLFCGEGQSEAHLLEGAGDDARLFERHH